MLRAELSPLPRQAAEPTASRRGDTSSKPSTSTPDTTESAAGRAVPSGISPELLAVRAMSYQQRNRLEHHFARPVDCPPEHLLRALGPVP
jgi:hypothetical protein